MKSLVFAILSWMGVGFFGDFGERPDFEVIEEPAKLVYPMDDFVERVRLKSFGTFVTPTDSPVSPERFWGYHAGLDAEIFEGEDDAVVRVYAIADGEVRVVRNVNGYGGVVIITHDVDQKTYTALYGHLSLNSVEVGVGERVEAGQQIAVLGKGYTNETAGERKHLHFSVVEGRDLVYAGYVQSEGELVRWIDPMTLFGS